MANLDESIFYTLYDLAGKSALGDALIVFLGDQLIYIAIVLFLIVGLRHWIKIGKQVVQFYIFALIATNIAEAISIVTKIISHRPRPFVAYDIPHLLTDSSFAFPSGHTTLLFALATATYFFNKKLAYVLFVIGVIVGMARIAGGVHYPSDILGGVVLGIVAGVIIYKLCGRYLLPYTQKRFGK